MINSTKKDAIVIADIISMLDVNQVRQLKFSLIEQGYGLDQFIKDPDRDVRIATIPYCNVKHLQQLAEDKDNYVLCGVVQRNYALDKIALNKDPLIQETIQNMLAVNLYDSLDHWIAENPDRCLLPGNIGNKSQIRIPSNEFEKFINDLSDNEIYELNEILDIRKLKDELIFTAEMHGFEIDLNAKTNLGENYWDVMAARVKDQLDACAETNIKSLKKDSIMLNELNSMNKYLKNKNLNSSTKQKIIDSLKSDVSKSKSQKQFIR